MRITPIKDEIGEGLLTWYSYVMRRLLTTLINRCLDMQTSAGCKWRARPLKT